MRLPKPNLATLLLLSLSIISARPNAIQDSTLSWGWGETIWYYTDYEYDEAGNLLFTIAYARDSESSAFIPKVKRSYRHTESPVYTEEILSTWSQSNENWTNIMKEENTYNERGDLIQYENASWTPDAWIPSRKRQYKFDDNGNQLLLAKYSWDLDNLIWKAVNYEEYSFNAQSQQTSHISYAWDDAIKDVVPRSKNEQVYNDNGLKMLTQSFDWDVVLNDWRSGAKTEYFYNDSDLLEHSKKSLRNGQSFENFMWSSFAHNSEGIQYLQIDSLYNSYGLLDPFRMLESIIEDGHIINTTEYNWSEDSEEWIPDKRDELTYSEQGKQLSEGHFIWSANDSTWNPFSYNVYGYDEYGNQVLEVKSEMDYNHPGELENTSKLILRYDESGNQTLYEKYQWDVNREDWGGRIIYTWTYDGDTRQLTHAVYDWDKDNWTWKGSRKTFNTFNTDGTLILDEGVKWEMGGSTSIANSFNHHSEMHVYPNPVHLSLNLEFDPGLLKSFPRIIIYSMRGTKQLEYTLESSRPQIDISMLEPGSYLLILDSGSKTVSRIFVKQ